MMKRPNAGTTLIELLVVIVVFLVGILAFVQIFPGGLGVLRDTRSMTVGRLMVRSESQRLAGQSNQLPEYIGAVQFLPGGGFLLDTSVSPDELMPPLNDPGANEGRITFGGQVLVGGNPIGSWAKVSGAARMSRVIGEGRPVSAPGNVLGHGLGSLMNLTFGPVYYFRDISSGVGTTGLIQAYSNDMEVRPGNRNAGYPDPNAGLYEPWVAFFVNGADATDVGVSPYLNQDQVWFNEIFEGGTQYYHQPRLQFTFYYDFGGTVKPVDVVLAPNGVVNCYQRVGAFGVVSIPQLITVGGFNAANYRGMVADSLRIQRQFQELPLAAPFTSDPLQYKVVNDNLGTLMVNPSAAAVRLPNIAGQERPLTFKVDYTVYDWRIIRDDFTVPAFGAASTVDVKLLVDGIKPRESQAKDGKPWTGLGGAGAPDTSMWTPDPNLVLGSQDFVLIDVATGGVVLGNTNLNAASAYFVDKRNGIVNFRDTDGNLANGITGTIAYQNPASPGTWLAQTDVPLNGRKLRALYAAGSDLAVQTLKPYRSYKILPLDTPTQLGYGQVYAGGTGGWGSPNRIYFPVSDLGHRVTVGEAVDVTGAVYREQQFRISRLESAGGVTFAVADLPFALSPGTGGVVPLKRVSGASLRVRALWNPSSFFLGANEVENYEAMKDWAKNWRQVDTETFLGAN